MRTRFVSHWSGPARSYEVSHQEIIVAVGLVSIEAFKCRRTDGATCGWSCVGQEGLKTDRFGQPTINPYLKLLIRIEYWKVFKERAELMLPRFTRLLCPARC